MRKASPFGAIKVTPYEPRNFSLPANSSTKFLSSLFKTSTALPLSASPQILSRGNFSLSTITDAIPFLARNNAALAPAGPAPIMRTSVVTELLIIEDLILKIEN